MLWKRVLSASASAAILVSGVYGVPQSSASTTTASISSATCCANCCDANGKSISPTLAAGVTASGSGSGSSAAATTTSTPATGTGSDTGTGAGSGTGTGAGSGGATSSSSSEGPKSSGTSTNSGNSTSNSNSSSTGGGVISNPYFFLYSNTASGSQNCLPDPSEVEGWNVIALAFLVNTGPAGQAGCWQGLDESTRQGIISKYHAAGIKVVLSVFGSTEFPTTNNEDPNQLASTFASFVKQYNFDGIDVDYEDYQSMSLKDGNAEKWVITFTQALRKELPQGQYLLTHAPLAPWFSTAYPKAYHEIDSQVGDLIDFYNIQFYNQGDYTTCDSLITKSGSQYPNSALLEIIQQKIPANKLVLGKPGTAVDANNGDGYIDVATLAQCVQTARKSGWNAGVMSWQYPHADSNWIKTIRSG